MKRTLILTVVLCLLGCSTVFGNGWYADVKGGVNFLTVEPLLQVDDIEINDKTNPGALLGLSAGYAFQGWRVEGEFSHRKNTLDGTYLNQKKVLDRDGCVESFSGLGNMLLLLPSWTTVSPYVGGGVGYGHTLFRENILIKESREIDGHVYHAGDVLKSKGSYNKFLGQFLLGANIALTENIGVRADYRYLKPIDSEIQNHSLVGSFDWKF